MLVLFENTIRRGISSPIGDRFVKSDDNKKIKKIDANNLYGWAMIQSSPYDETEFAKIVQTYDILKTEDNKDIG